MSAGPKPLSVVIEVDRGPHAPTPCAPEPRISSGPSGRTTTRSSGPFEPRSLHHAPHSRGPFYEPDWAEAATDAELLAAHVAGSDPSAFTELIRRHRSRLWVVAGAILRNPQDADDAVQDAMLRAFIHAPRFRGDSSVYVWLRTLTINVSTSMATKRARLAGRTISQDTSFKPDPATAEATSAVELDELLRRALSEVPEDQRNAFVLVQLLDMPVGEVAELQMVRPATIYTRVYRARLRLVELLDYRQVIDLLHHVDR